MIIMFKNVKAINTLYNNYHQFQLLLNNNYHLNINDWLRNNISKEIKKLNQILKKKVHELMIKMIIYNFSNNSHNNSC